MITLAFDSTAKAASVAVLDDEKLLGLYNIDNGLTQSELLLPMAENLMKNLKLGIEKIDLLACTVGPGSFTGVRIGTALVKGLAFGRNIPCVAVSTLEALAENLVPLDGILVPCMDARRSQVYSATFRSNGEELIRLTPDRAIAISELADELNKYENENIYLSGDGYKVAYDELCKLGVKLKATPSLLVCENAYSVGLIAQRKFKSGEYTDDLGINPTYLRVPQAERERLAALKNENEKGESQYEKNYYRR